jgi:hypothetical protein
VSKATCEKIAKLRRKLHRIGIKHILFLDETYRRIGDVEKYTIRLPGEPSFVSTPSSSAKSPRVDMIACVSGEHALLPALYAPDDRERGITKAMLLNCIRNGLAQAAGALDIYPLILVCDRATIHNPQEMKETFNDWGCQELVEVIKLPPAAAKRISPLDNALFNVWRHDVLKDGPLETSNIVQRMSDAWNRITSNQIHAQYHHAGLIRGQDPYFDCPNPAVHRHGD